jgi:hypothetical protein
MILYCQLLDLRSVFCVCLNFGMEKLMRCRCITIFAMCGFDLDTLSGFFFNNISIACLSDGGIFAKKPLGNRIWW